MSKFKAGDRVKCIKEFLSYNRKRVPVLGKYGIIIENATSLSPFYRENSYSDDFFLVKFNRIKRIMPSKSLVLLEDLMYPIAKFCLTTTENIKKCGYSEEKAVKQL